MAIVGEDAGGPTTVLIIEDDRLTAASLCAALAEGGCTVVGVAHDGVTALELAGQKRPAVALCDVHLQGVITGLTVGRELAADGVAVIYVTGDVTGAVMEGRDHAADFLTKPIDEATLLATIARSAARRKPVPGLRPRQWPPSR